MSKTLEKRKTMVRKSGVGKLYAYITACCFEAAVRPSGLREFSGVFDVPGTPGTITKQEVKHHVK